LTPLPNGVEANSSNEWTTLMQSKSGGRIGLGFEGLDMLAEAKFPVWKGKRNFEIHLKHQHVSQPFYRIL